MDPLWYIYLALTLGLVLLQTYFSVVIIDLDSDRVNPIDMATSINKLVVPEMVTVALCFVIAVLGNATFFQIYNVI